MITTVYWEGHTISAVLKMIWYTLVAITIWLLSESLRSFCLPIFRMVFKNWLFICYRRSHSLTHHCREIISVIYHQTISDLNVVADRCTHSCILLLYTVVDVFSAKMSKCVGFIYISWKTQPLHIVSAYINKMYQCSSNLSSVLCRLSTFYIPSPHLLKWIMYTYIKQIF